MPIMVFGGKEGPCFTSLDNDPQVVEMKVASDIMRRIFVDMGSSIDIITWDCMKKLKYPGGKSFPWFIPS